MVLITYLNFCNAATVNFATQDMSDSMTWASKVVWADFNNDEKLDFIACYNANLHIQTDTGFSVTNLIPNFEVGSGIGK